jgi:hypothetical protein
MKYYISIPNSLYKEFKTLTGARIVAKKMASPHKNIFIKDIKTDKVVEVWSATYGGKFINVTDEHIRPSYLGGIDDTLS